MLARMSASQGQGAATSTNAKSNVFFTMEDAKASFNLFCAVCGIGSLAMPSNYARAGPLYASLALGFMVFANTYATLKLSRVMLVAPSSVKTYGDLGEWALGKWGRFFTVLSQMGVCLLVPIAFLVLGSTLLDVLLPDSFSQTFWIIFMAITVMPVCLIPTLKESAGMAFAGCMGTLVADIIAVAILQYNLRGHPSIPDADVTLHQVLTSFGNLALAYGAAPVLPDLQREHSQPQRMPRVVVVTILIISAFFLTIALAGYTAGGCQISGNILYSIVSTDDPLGLAPLGFHADRGAVVMSYLFMQMHITIAFSTLMMPPFFMAERLILGMHESPAIVQFGKEDELDVDLEQEKHSYVQGSTPAEHGVSQSSLVEKAEGRMSHLRVALEFNEEITEQQLAAEYSGAKNTLRYVALRIVIVVILVIIAVVLQDKFLDLQDFTGATAHTTNCLLIPLFIYLRIFWKSVPMYEKIASAIVIVACAFAGVYVAIHAGKELFSPSDDETLFPYCYEELQDVPYYVRNTTN
ncbi:hypothetical protein PHYBOEH_000815 [Phytophthora boehmeriae]|uniref:Amino acid transporter transmembrane domain-containing protein n=1 Tax=Phytophthora boehmeriae TaxID=109152 RepID=A0A8T1V946_9STRA|nr:hypothetical protein PHYBOEH_000815 [Phytophthora boehmeriae]